MLQYPEGAQAVYELIDVVSTATLTEDVFLTQLIDAHGNITSFYYSTNNSQVLLTNVVDADGQTNIFRYGTNAPTQLTKIENPFGQKVSFLYDYNSLLPNLVDLVKFTNSIPTVINDNA